MKKPIILLVGQANSGKDTIAQIICKYYNGQSLALADPIKRIAQFIFGFEDEQLWGPSSKRGEELSSFNHQGDWSKYQESWQMAYGRVLLAENAFYHNDIFSVFSKAINKKTVEGLKDWIIALQAELKEQKRPLTPRLVLQSLGTEYGRAIKSDIWIDIAQDNIKKLLRGDSSYIPKKGVIDSDTSCDWVVVSDGRFENEIKSIRNMGGVVVEVVNPHSTPVNSGITAHSSEEEQKGLPKKIFDFSLVNDKTKGFDFLNQEISKLMDKLFFIDYLAQKSRRDEP